MARDGSALTIATVPARLREVGDSSAGIDESEPRRPPPSRRRDT